MRSSRQPHPEITSVPAARFLGPEAAMGGPFMLLGVPYDALESQILRARDRRMAQIDQHPHRTTPDADEVRLAVHTAVSQLLDPELNTQLQLHWPPGTLESHPHAWSSGHFTAIPGSVIRSAKITLAMCGGWNPKARRRLAHLARRHRIPAIKLIESLSPSVPTGGFQAAGRMPRYLSPSSLQSPWAIVYTLLFIMVGVLGYQGWLKLRSVPAEAAQVVTTEPHQGTPTPQEKSAAQGQEPPVLAKRTIGHYSAIAHEIEQASRRAPQDPGGAAQAAAGYLPQLFSMWTAFPEPELQQTAENLRVVTSASQSEPQASAMLTQALGLPLSANDPSERGAALAIRRFVHSPEGTTPSISELLHDALKEIGSQSTTDEPQWWEAWIHAVGAIHDIQSEPYAGLVLAGVESRLVGDSSHPDWITTSRLFSGALSWREGSVERVWLLGVFADSRFSSARLSVFTEGIATHSSASGVQSTMVLDPDASMEARLALADQYRAAWRSRTDLDPFVEQLNDELLAAVSLTGPGLDPSVAKDRFVELAHLNTVCSLYARGDLDGAQLLMNTPPQVSWGEGSSGSLGFESSQADQQLALDLINANDADEELVLIRKIESLSSIAQDPAHALVRIAMTGAGRPSRTGAANAIEHHAASPQVLIALDLYLMSRGSTSRLRSVIGSVVEVVGNGDGEDWDTAAHRALLGAIADSTGGLRFPDANAFGKYIAEQCAARINAAPRPASVGLGEVGEQLLTAMGVACLRVCSDTGRVESIMAMRSLRYRRAETVPQRFVADQWAIVELAALHTRCSVSGSGGLVDPILAGLGSRVRESSSVEDQIAQLERARSQIWLLVLNEGGGL